MKVKAFLAAAIGAVAAAASTHAATITYTLSLNDNGKGQLTTGSFAVYASVNTGDNSGIAAFTYGLSGLTPHQNIYDPDAEPGTPESIPDPIPSNPIFRAPVTTYKNSAGTTFKTAGFVTQASGSGVLQQTGSQDTTGTATDIRITYGIGQTATSLVAYQGTSVYSSGTSSFGPTMVLLSTGTFLPTDNVAIGAGNATTGGNVFQVAQNKSTFAATGAYVTQNLAPVPEPTTLAVLGLGGVSLMARRRKAVAC